MSVRLHLLLISSLLQLHSFHFLGGRGGLAAVAPRGLVCCSVFFTGTERDPELRQKLITFYLLLIELHEWSARNETRLAGCSAVRF